MGHMNTRSVKIVVLLCAYHSAFFGTELEITNRTDGMLTVNPIVSLAGITSSGKALENIAHNSSVQYNSGIYKIIGLNVKLKRLSPDKKSYRVSVGKMRNWPTTIDVTNRNALFVLGDPLIHSPHIGK